jgi:23S rRNA pseudouridine1911/1915/1917 synthase
MIIKNKKNILYESKHLLVLDKPAGIIVHEDGKEEGETISAWAKKLYNLDGVGEEGREGIVHRLDRNTTGVLLIAKDRPTYNFLKEQFKEHSVRKVYRAIVEGHIRNDTGMISIPIARARSDFRKRTIVDPYAQDTRGEEREAITRYKVLERATSPQGRHYTYVEVYPVTGRTHQIRAHMRGIRHPIIGDDLYGSRSGKHDAARSMLHACKITCKETDGATNSLTVTAPLPVDFKNTLALLGFQAGE